MLEAKKDFKNYIKPLVFICKTVCFWTFNYDYINSAERTALKISSLTFFSFFIFCSYRKILVIYIPVKLINSTPFAHIANELRITFGYVTIIIACVNNFIYRNTIKKCIDELCTFEYQNSQFYCERENISTKLLFTIITLVGYISYDYYCFSLYLSHFLFKYYILTMLPLSLHLLFVVVYNVTLCVIRNIYKEMNIHLIFIIKTLETGRILGNVRKKMYLKQVMKICSLHIGLAKLAKQLNVIYEIPQIVSIQYSFMAFVSNYNYLRITMYPIIVENGEAVPLAINDVFWCTYFYSVIFLNLRPWKLIENEVRIHLLFSSSEFQIKDIILI